jgi:hypothetical protein
LRLGPPITAEVYLRTLGLYCGLAGITPGQILKDGPTKRFRDGLTDFVRQMEKKGKGGSYITRFKKVVLPWLACNNVDAKLKVSLKGASETPTIASGRVPSRDELSRILRMASPRGRVSIAVMAFSGLIHESLGDFGTDGITLEDFTEARVTSKGIEFAKAPAILLVRRALSKSQAPVLHVQRE